MPSMLCSVGASHHPVSSAKAGSRADSFPISLCVFGGHEALNRPDVSKTPSSIDPIIATATTTTAARRSNDKLGS